MATIYVSPLGSGNGSGSSATNAMKFGQLDTAIQKAGPGGTVLLLADQGAYNVSGSVAISSGGLAGAPVTVKGADSAGNAMDITINGTRDPTWTVGEATGNYIFKLYNGADNLKFEGMDFNNIGMGFMLAGNLKNITIQNMEADNVRYFVGNYAGGGATTASVDGLTVKDVEVHGFSKSVVLLKYDTHNVVLDNVYGDSEYQDGDRFAMGVMLDGTVHDVLIKNSTMKNAIGVGTTGDYWNGDGFVAERGVYNLRFENTYASGNADGGYDLKATNVVMVGAVAEDNTRNFRLWASAELIDCIGIDPHKRGGTGGQAQVWLDDTATVKITGGYFADSGSSTKVFVNDGGTLAVGGTEVWHAGTLNQGGITGIGSAVIHKLGATGLWSNDGEKYLPDGTSPDPAPAPSEPPPEPNPDLPTNKTMSGTSGADSIAPGTADHWTITAAAGNDKVTTLGGNDKVSGGGGNDTISTGAGNDILTGGAGADILTGGTGNDLFDFNTLSDSKVTSRDTITDFALGADKVDLSGIDAVGAASGNQAFTFIGEAGFTKQAGQLRVDHSDPTKTTILGDVNGDGIADFAVNLTGNVQLGSGDFIL